MRKVEYPLIIRVGVDGGHETTLESETVHEHLGERRETVRGTGCVGDDVMGCGIVLAVVHAHDDRDVLVLGRSGDDDLLGASVAMSLCLVRVGEEAGRLNDRVHTKLAPRE